MTGIAKKHFFEKQGRIFWDSTKISQWPMIEKMVSQGRLNDIDYALAKRLLQDLPHASEEAAAFICHLSISSRQGNLCIRIDENTIQPHPKDCWIGDDEDHPLTPEDSDRLTAMIIQGSRSLPESLLVEVTSQDNSVPLKPICQFDQHLFYWQRNWVYESLFIHHWMRLDQVPPKLSLDSQKIERELRVLVESQQLLAEQAAAILLASQQSLTLITGGPGTGKTYTAGQLIKLFWEAMTPEQQQQCRLVLAAPTGKAAANLQASFKKAIGSIPIPIPSAKTLHSLLGIRSAKSTSSLDLSATETLAADIILVDESSMIDVRLMAHLFAAVKSGSRLILLGDRYQLPPVEAGSLFADLIDHHDKSVELKVCLRAELKEIVDLSQSIQQGNTEKVVQIISSNDSEGIYRLPFSHLQDQPRIVYQMLLKHTEDLFPSDYRLLDHPKQLLEAFNRFRLLSPLRQGPFGVEELNSLFLKQALKKMGKSHPLMIPIMIVRNDYRLELFNGEVGILVCRSQGYEASELRMQEGDYAIFPALDTQSDVRKFPSMMLPQHEYAYCLSVHKSQGSEFERVLLMLPKGSESFGREVFYTAVTRARRRLEICATDEVIRATILRQGSRFAGVGLRIELSRAF